MVESSTKVKFEGKKELFEVIAESIICDECKIVPRGAIFQNIDSGIIFCQPCFRKMPKDPIEKNRIFRNSVLERCMVNVAQQITSCKFRKDGCPEVKDLDSIYRHEEKCRFKMVLCPFGYCEEYVNFSKLKNHLDKEHNNRIADESNGILSDGEKIGSTIILEVDGINVKSYDTSNNFWLFSFTHKEEPFMLVGRAELDSEEEEEISNFHFWIQYFGGRFKSKNYSARIQIGTRAQGQFIYNGPIKCIDDKKTEVFKKRFGLIVEAEAVKKYIRGRSLEVEVEIYDLDPEDYAFDSDISPRSRRN